MRDDCVLLSGQRQSSMFLGYLMAVCGQVPSLGDLLPKIISLVHRVDYSDMECITDEARAIANHSDTVIEVRAALLNLGTGPEQGAERIESEVDPIELLV